MEKRGRLNAGRHLCGDWAGGLNVRWSLPTWGGNDSMFEGREYGISQAVTGWSRRNFPKSASNLEAALKMFINVSQAHRY